MAVGKPVLSLELGERECALLRAAIAVKMASVTRAYNNTMDGELKAVYQRQIQEYADLQRKFPG